MPLRLNSKNDLAGFQSEERILEAVPIRIDYQSPRYEHFLRQDGRDYLLSFSIIKGQWNQGDIRQTTSLDPYQIRDRFEAVDSAEGAVQFLSEAGQFWVWPEVRYSQFQEWRRYFEWLRIPRERAMKSSEGKKAWLTARGFENQFFTLTDQEFTGARFRGSDLPPEALQRNEGEDRSALWHLRRFALSPGSIDDGGRISLGWYDPKDSHTPEDVKARQSAAPKGGSANYQPFLKIETHYILEAIAATIYVDNVHRLKHGKCRQCGRVFEIKSDHGQEFCPPPKWLNSSPCKNAFFQHERRTTIATLKAVLLEGWSQGLSESEIRRSWVEKRIEPTKKLISEAKEKAEKEAKRQSRQPGR